MYMAMDYSKLISFIKGVYGTSDFVTRSPDKWLGI